MTLFKAEGISVRYLRDNREDRELLLKWLSDPDLLEFAYGEDAPWDRRKIDMAFMKKSEGGENVTGCVIEQDTRPIGFIQYYRVLPESYKFNRQVPFAAVQGGYGVDLFIGEPGLWGQGIGTKVVSAMTDYLFSVMDAKMVCADPQDNNIRSVRCWEKAGFSLLGIIENYDFPQKKSKFMVKKR